MIKRQLSVNPPISPRMHFRKLRERYVPYGSIRHRLLSGASWTLASSLTLYLGGMAISVLCGRLLGAEGFGELGMVRSTVLLLAALSGSGLGTAATKCVADFRAIDRARLGRLIGLLTIVCIGFGFVTTLLSLCFAGPVAASVLNSKNLTLSFRVAALLVPFQMLQGLLTAFLSGFESFRVLAFLVVLDAVFLLIFVPAGLLLFGLNGAIGGYVAVAMLSCLTRYFAFSTELRQEVVPFSIEIRREDVGVLWSGATPLVMLWIVWHSAEWFARLPLTRQPGGYAELGIFVAALAWSNLVLFLPQQLSAPSYPILTNLLAAGNMSGFRRAAGATWLACTGLAVTTALPLIVFSEAILAWYGAEYSGGSMVMTLLVIAFAVNGIARVPALLLIASGKAWLHLLLTLLWAGVVCIGSTLLSKHGAVGLATAYLMAFIVYLVVHGVACLPLLWNHNTGKPRHATS